MKAWIIPAAAMALLLSACGGGDQEEEGAEETQPPPASTVEATPKVHVEKIEGVAPTADELVGTWSRIGVSVLWRFNRDGTFAFDRSNLDTPYAHGTYELDGRTIRFTALGPRCGDQWVWTTGILEEEDQLDDELNLRFVDDACGEIAGAKWTLLRISR